MHLSIHFPSRSQTRLLSVLLAFIFISQIQAQPFSQTIRGTISDATSQSPVIGALIILEGSNPLVGTTSDIDGNFRLNAIPIGRPMIQISMLGYQPVKLSNLVLTSSKELILNINLEVSTIQGNAFEVVAKMDKDKPLNELAGISARTFSVDEAQRYAGSFGDPARLATSFAGVVAANDQRNDIVVRGNTPLGVLWRFEGIDIPSPSHYSGAGTSGGAVSILNTNVLANSDFLSGAFAAEYGNATSAAFDVKMRRGNNEKHEFTGQVGFNGFELGAEGPISPSRKSSYLINYRYSTLGAFNAVGIEFVKGGVPQYQDVSMKLHFPHKEGYTSLFGIAGTSDIHFESEKDSLVWITDPAKRQDLKNGSDMAVAGMSHVRFINPKTSIRTTLAATGNRFRTNIDSLSPVYQMHENFRSKMTERKLTGTIVLNSRLNTKTTVRAGVIVSRLMYNSNVSRYSITSDSQQQLIDFNGNGDLIQGYAQWHYKAGQRWTFDAGLHALHYYVNAKSSLEPRVSVNFQASGNKRISLGYGNHSRVLPMTIYLRETQLADGSSIQTNKNLDLLRSNHFVAGYDWLIREHLRLKTEVYYQQQYNVGIQDGRKNSISVLNYGAAFGDVIGPDSLISTGKGYNAGLELTLEKFFSDNYYFLITGSVYDSKYKGSDGIERNTAFNNRFAFNLLAGKEIAVGKSKQNVVVVSFRQVITGGMWTTPIDLEASRMAGYEISSETQAYTEQLPMYLRTDIRIGFRRNKKRFTEEYGLDFQNLTNHKNLFSRSYNNLSQQIENNYQVGIFPMMMYRINF